jgi:4-hydroxy-tetrahydrodipicolinate reductase
MKACVVGYGAMGKVISTMQGDELAFNVAVECETKTLNDAKIDFDCIIDYSNPANLEMIIDYVSKTKKPVVFATTGYTEEQIKKIEELSKIAPVLRSANISLGVILLNRLVKEVTPILKDSFDIEVVEAHHNIKVDSPSGTAKMLLKSITDETGYKVVAPKFSIESHL